MKNNLFYLSFILFIIAGCTKEKATLNELKYSDEQVAQLINNFEANGKSNLKAEQIVLPDSAIWYLEATANYNYGDASHETNKLVYDSCFINLAFTNGHITLYEVWSKYEDLIDSLQISYQQIDSLEKQLMAVNVSLLNATSTTLHCKVEFVFAIGHYNYHLCDFDPASSGWEPVGSESNSGGTCDGLYLDRDAGTEIQKKVMTCKAVPSGSYYYENEIEKTYYAINFEVENFNGSPNYMAYYLYYNEIIWPGYGHCLSPEECNFYLNGTKSIIYNTPESQGGPPSNYSFVSLRIKNDVITGRVQNQCHTLIVTYGILRMKDEPPQSL